MKRRDRKQVALATPPRPRSPSPEERAPVESERQFQERQLECVRNAITILLSESRDPLAVNHINVPGRAVGSKGSLVVQMIADRGDDFVYQVSGLTDGIPVRQLLRLLPDCDLYTDRQVMVCVLKQSTLQRRHTDAVRAAERMRFKNQQQPRQSFMFYLAILIAFVGLILVLVFHSRK